MKTLKVDTVTLEVLRGGLSSLCTEMGIAMERSSYSPIFSEGLDYSYALFDGTAEMVAQAAFDPCHLGAMPYSVRASVNEIGLGNLEPGDTILVNDPFNGGSHISDFTAMMPVFHNGKIVAMPAARAHQIDSGGMAPGGFAGDAREIFQEGLIIPPVKANMRHQESRDLWKLILANVRLPKAVQGDLRAMFGALRVGEKRILQLVEKHGLPTWQASLDEIKNVSERIMRKEIDKIPDGNYEYEDYVDDTGRSSEPAKIHVRVEVKGDELFADYSGSSPQVSGPINASYAITAGNTLIGVLHSIEIGGDYAFNQGTFRPIHVSAPKGTIVNPNFPAPLQGGPTELSNRIVDTVIGALAQATNPDRIKAACHGSCYGMTAGGIHHETSEPFVMYAWSLGGMGARAAGDGNPAQMPFATNNKGPFIEVTESRYPVIHEEYSLRGPDTAGPGKFRGGIGTRLVWRLTAKECELNCLSERHKISPYGVFDGLPPLPTECGHFCDTRLSVGGKTMGHAPELFGKSSPSKWSNVTIAGGDTVEIILSSGGGWGSPLERDPMSVLDDVTKGFVSVKGAAEHYGVVINQKTLKVDRQETSRLRERKGKTGPEIEIPRNLKVLQTVQFAGDGRLEAGGRGIEGCVSATENANAIIIKLEADNFEILTGRVKSAREKLRAKQVRVLTTQLVPKNFKRP